MNREQLLECIGNIDDGLVEQAEQIADYRRQHLRKRIRGIAAAAAMFLLMACSFGIGTLVSAREVHIKVPVKQETVTLEGSNLTMIFPDSWNGKYSVEKDGSNYIVYSKQIREAVGEEADKFYGGFLFSIVCYDEAMSPEQFVDNGYDVTGYRYLLSTKNNTYVLHNASDVQWDVNSLEQETIYTQMASEIKDIRFVVERAFED